jgi:Patatin-like phospholipase
MVALLPDEVLCAEAAAIHGALLEPDERLYRALNELNSAALCLSGGGIRSAAFALGVIQALAIHPRCLPAGSARKSVDRAEDSLLAKFHYLSTVSGGGYAGSWLSAWRLHQPFPQIWKQLIGRPEGPDFEPNQISWLRSFTNYLTPKRGIASGDTWAPIVLGLRNLLLNWLVIIPPLCVLVLGLKVLALISTWVILWCVDMGWFPGWKSIESFQGVAIGGKVTGWFTQGSSLRARLALPRFFASQRRSPSQRATVRVTDR